jgi:transcriptional regulator with XRE-family HTH domain
MSGEHLRSLLRERNLSGREVAVRVGVCTNTVSNWLTGQTHPVPKTAEALAELLGTSIDGLIRPPLREEDNHGPRQSPPDPYPAEGDAIKVLQRLLESAHAVEAIHEAGPNLMDILAEAEEVIRRRRGLP